MNKIYLFEPSIGSENIGDKIITDSTKKEMGDFLASAFCVELPTHTPLSNRYMYFLRGADFKFVLGSNIIVGDLNPVIHLKQWNISPLTLHNLKDVILIGVGAQQYNQKIAFFTKLSYKYMLNKHYKHSVRDGYTENVMKKMGFDNVLNTACPTMWSLTPSHCSQIPQKKVKNVVVTFTDYKPNPQRDNEILSVLKADYEKVFFWPQGHNDYNYFMRLNETAGICVINSNLKDYDNFLRNNDVDYVGTRLHGGIRALQNGKRTIIIGIDNRAKELNKDFNLPILAQESLDTLSGVINGRIKTEIALPISNIQEFLSQFEINYEGK